MESSSLAYLSSLVVLNPLGPLEPLKSDLPIEPPKPRGPMGPIGRMELIDPDRAEPLLSRYLMNRTHVYGVPNQEEYEAIAKEAIDDGTDFVKEEKPRRFFDLYDFFCEVRRKIAIIHKSIHAERFGQNRLFTTGTQYRCSIYTPLGNPYQEYNKIFMRQLLPHIITMKTKNKKVLMHSELYLGRKNSIEIELLDRNEMKCYTTERIEKELQKTLGIRASFIDIIGDFELLKTINRSNRDLYKKIIKKVGIDNLYYKNIISSSEYEKNVHVVCTFYLEINGSMRETSRYFTWFDSKIAEPFKKMETDSIVVIGHQDRFLIEATLDEINKMFEHALSWNKARHTIKDLKDRVVLFRATFAHCMRSCRGDGAIGDWLELMIYQFHGFSNTKFNQRKLPCVEPLVSMSLTRYRRKYEKIITIKE